jgi:hypothetical protein
MAEKVGEIIGALLCFGLVGPFALAFYMVFKNKVL